MRTGYFDEKQNTTIFPEQPTDKEIIATISHINNTLLAAAKMYLECIDIADPKILVAIAAIKQAIKVNYDSLKYI